MYRRQQQRGATPVEELESTKRQRPFMALLACGALLILVGLSMSPQQEHKAESDILVIPAPEEASSPTPPAIELAISSPPKMSLKAQEVTPSWQDIQVNIGDNLSLIFSRAGFTDADLFRVTASTKQKPLKNIYPGEIIGFQSDVEGNLLALRHVQSPIKTTIYSSESGKFRSETIEREADRSIRQVTLNIDSSLFIAGINSGLRPSMIMELAGIFGGVIDFIHDPRPGDVIHVLYEELSLEGVYFDDGPILASSYTNRGKIYEAYRYTDISGGTSYYNQEGVSMRKAFLRAPLDFTRVSSNFNPNRLHPIYKTQRPHRGTDYAAPRGTPVYAAGDGQIIASGYNRNNGNYVFIKHGEQFETHYLHLHRRKVAKGARVKQGTIIGTVGSTGAATGPHLHYEFLVNGVHRNPRNVHRILPKANSLPKNELPRYKIFIKQNNEQLALLRKNQLLAWKN